jgi:hypothetical protein
MKCLISQCAQIKIARCGMTAIDMQIAEQNRQAGKVSWDLVLMTKVSVTTLWSGGNET